MIDEKMHEEQKELGTYLMKRQMDIKDFLVCSWNILYFIVSILWLLSLLTGFVLISLQYVGSFILYICIPSILFQSFSSLFFF